MRVATHNLLRFNCQSWGKEWLWDILRDIELASPHTSPIVIAVQEALRWKCGNIGHFRICTVEESDCALLIPDKLTFAIRCTFSGGRYFGALLGKWIIIFVHLIW